MRFHAKALARCAAGCRVLRQHRGSASAPPGDRPARAPSTPRSIVTRDAKAVQVLAWDWQQPQQARSNRPFYTIVQPTHGGAPLVLDLKGFAPGAYAVNVYRTGFRANDAHTAYLEMGSPKNLSAEQVGKLQALTTDKPEVRSLKVGANGSASLTVPMRANDVVLVKIAPAH